MTFFELIIDPCTTYSSLLESFLKLYNDLIAIPASVYLTTNQVTTFVSDDLSLGRNQSHVSSMFWKKTSTNMKSKLKNFLSIALPKFAVGFDLQKGTIFGFGPSTNVNTGTVLKIFQTDKETLSRLDTFTDVNNMHQERNGSSVSYGLVNC